MQRRRADATSEDNEVMQTVRGLYRTMDRTATMTDDTVEFLSQLGITHDQFSYNNGRGGVGVGDGSASTPSATATIDRQLRYLERQISRSLSSKNPIWSDSNETKEFLDSVETLISTIEGLDPVIPGDRQILDFATDILDRSMIRLGREFKYLMELSNNEGGGPMAPFSGSLPPYDEVNPPEDEDEDEEEEIPVAYPITDYNVIIEALPSGTMSDLREIGKLMVKAKYSKECADVYILSRRDFLEESLSRMGLLQWSFKDVHDSPWKEIEDEIKKWVQGSKVTFLILFPSELRLCSRVFLGVGPTIFAGIVFAEVCRVSANQLLGFADSVASGNRSPERLFSIVDLYEALRDLLPEIESLFSDPYTSFVWEESSNVLLKLGDAIRGIFTELENLIRRDPSDNPGARCGVHPISRYVINYLRTALSSWKTLEEVEEEDRGGGRPFPSNDRRIRPNSPLSVRVGWILKTLLTNLDAKAAAYRDASMSNFFLLNNGRYIISKTSDELGEMLGENWVRGQAARVRKWQLEYRRHTWGKLVDGLRMDDVSYGADLATVIKGKVQKFNSHFESIHETQVGWSPVDENLRKELIEAAIDDVIPAYQSLVARFRITGRDAVRQMDRWFKYGETQLRQKIQELFLGPQRGG